MLATMPTDAATTGAYMLVSGRVQGVGYRWFVRSHAESLGLTGWARNRREGTVELEVFGLRSKIEQLAQRLREGPPASDVTEVTVHWLPASEGHAPTRFEIRPTA
jgi:acylphosphatase